MESVVTRLLIVLAIASVSGAEAQAQSATRKDLLSYDLRIDVPILGVATVGWFVTELQPVRDRLAPTACRWCERGQYDAETQRTLRLDNARPALIASDVLAFGIVPLLAVGLDGLAAGIERRPWEFLVDALILFEAVAISANIVQIVKYSAGRERPFVHTLPPEEKRATANPADNNLSFPSAHTNLAFSLAVSAGMIATLRHYRLAPLVWSFGLAAAMSTAYLRIAADRHYLTDVLAGAMVGSSVGMLVPLFHVPKVKRALRGGSIAAMGVQSGGGLAMGWAW